MDTRLQEGIIGFLLFVVGKEKQTANFICKWGNSLMCKRVVRFALLFFFFFFFFFFFANIPAIVIFLSIYIYVWPVILNNNNNNNHIQRRNSSLLQSPHCAANHLQHIRSSGPGAIVCKSYVTHRASITCSMSYYVPCGTKGQLSH